MSFFSRLWQRIRKPTHYVGKDLEGNKYYEYPGVWDDPRRTKRVVKYRRGADMHEYVGGHKRLAVQWTSWLTHTRLHAPTLEELHADMERQRRVLYNAAMIEARDREERAVQQRVAAKEREKPAMAVNAPKVDDKGQIQTGPQIASSGLGTPKKTESPLNQPSKARPVPEQSSIAADELQPWTPRTIRRG